MEETALNTLPLEKYGGKIIKCACGGTHIIKTADFVFHSDAIASLAKTAANYVPGGSNLIIISDKKHEEILSEKIGKQLSRAGYRITKYVYDENDSPVCSAKGIKSIPVPEDARLVVALGGADICDAAKAFSAMQKLPLIILPLSPESCNYLASSVYIYKGNIAESCLCEPPRAVICDTSLLEFCDDHDNASGFGSIMSKLIALFDWQTSSMLEGETYCPFIAEQVIAIADSVMDDLNNGYRNRQEVSAVILEHNIRLSALIQMLKGSRLMGGGESQAAHCMELLIRTNNRVPHLRGENEFIMSTILSKIYSLTLSNLENNPAFTPPPDYNMRLEKAVKYLGVDEISFAAKARTYDSKDLKLHDFKLKEYREELLLTIIGYDKKLTRAMKIFKRLYSDCGYSLIGYLKNSDVSVCLGLAPDIRENFTFLTQMKNMGLLDRYIS